MAVKTGDEVTNKASKRCRLPQTERAENFDGLLLHISNDHEAVVEAGLWRPLA